MNVKKDIISHVSKEILMSSGVSESDAEIVAKTIVFAHERGKHTHGIGRLPIYLRKIREGLMSAATKCEVLQDSGAVYHIDARDGFGQIASYRAAEKATEKSKIYGISISLVKNSNSFGTAGYYALQISKQGFIGLVCSNASPAIASPDSLIPLFGTNPICISFPSNDPDNPFLLDMSTSVAARSKIRAAEKNGETIPEGWALDKNGNPTCDPGEALLGSMLPIGGAKGAGLSMAVDLLAGLLSGSGFAGDVKGLNHKTEKSRCGQAIIAVDPLKFMSKELYNDRIKYFYDKVHECGGTIPGERSYQIYLTDGDYAEIPDKTAESINALADSLGITAKLY